MLSGHSSSWVYIRRRKSSPSRSFKNYKIFQKRFSNRFSTTCGPLDLWRAKEESRVDIDWLGQPTRSLSPRSFDILKAPWHRSDAPAKIFTSAAPVQARRSAESAPS